MSVWAHVSGMVRMSSGGLGSTVTCDPTLGPTTIDYPEYDGDHTDYSSYEEAFAAAEKAGTPCGSEGSVQWSWTPYAKDSSVIVGHFDLWGDLRDFESADAIFEWLKLRLKQVGKENSMWIRDCAVKITIRDNVYFITNTPITRAAELIMIKLTPAMQTLHGEI